MLLKTTNKVSEIKKEKQELKEKFISIGKGFLIGLFIGFVFLAYMNHEKMKNNFNNMDKIVCDLNTKECQKIENK